MSSTTTINKSFATDRPQVQLMPNPQAEEITFLRLPQVRTITGLSKSSLYALIRANSFPAPVRLGPRTVAWVRSEVTGWAVERAQAPRCTAVPHERKQLPQRASVGSWAAPRKLA